jgi:ABC-type Mn2+/Zn2+ transport system ATPase subunit
MAEGKRYLRRDFSKLSLGQQQSVLLSILFFSKSNEPLVIDQPGDNLDSEFIYKTVVRSLRRVKGDPAGHRRYTECQYCRARRR